MAVPYARINPDILTWARERARLSVSELAAKLKVSKDKIEAWERGDQPPTFIQAQAFASKTHISFGYLYLKQPPEESLLLPDLRTVGGKHPDRPSPELIKMTQIVLRRQEWYAEYLRDQGIDCNPHVGRFSVDASVAEVVQDMRRALGVLPHPERGGWDDYFRRLIRRIEGVGILVMREGYIGRAFTLGKISHHQYQTYVTELLEQFRNRERTERPIPYYRTLKGKVSETFSKVLVSEARRGRILLRDAGSLLNMKPYRIAKYAKELGL